MEPLTAAGQADPVALQAMSQPGLSHRPSLFEVMHEPHDLTQQIMSQIGPEAGAHRAQQQASEAWAGIVWGLGQPRPADGEPSGGGYRSGVKDFQLGQQHHAKLAGEDSR